ncbi:hypothetical protein SEA_JACOREN57_71 [Mycobacterium phage JacoRen57]|nr:hypothetical protein SEA_JACOREN57_71 [Mycobacterium phage JacoRen57]
MTTNEISHYMTRVNELRRPYNERLRAFVNRPGPRIVHPFVTDTLAALIDLIGSMSDDAVDEYQIAIYAAIDGPEFIEEQAACGYDNDAFADPESAEYRAYCTEVDTYLAIHNHLSEFERGLLSSIVDVQGLIDDNTEIDVDSALIAWFERVMDTIENL